MIQFFALILKIYHWENASLINGFHMLRHEATWFGRSQSDKQNKTNYLASYMDMMLLAFTNLI
jgi:hypothetical protein